jgi:hypothetical protein
MCCPSDVTYHSVLDKLYNSNLLLFQLYTNNVRINCYEESRGSSVDVVTGWPGEVRFPLGEIFFLLHSVQTGSGTHPASCPVGSGGDFSRSKEAGA